MRIFRLLSILTVERRRLKSLGLIAATFIVSGGCGSGSHADRDVRTIAKSLCTKNVVLLGELPSHGEARTFALKARIVQELVRECGFNAVLFEAPIYEFVGLYDAIRSGTAEPSLLKNAVGRFWLTQELAPHRSWLYESALSNRLLLGGLDDQVSVTSHYARQKLPEMTPPECKATVKRNLEWGYDDAQPFNALEKQRLQQCAAMAAESKDVLLQNFKTYVERQVTATNARSRDEVMRDNLLWYVTQLPHGSKVIVWTATVHAARKQGQLTNKPLGEYLIATSGSVVSIGFTALAGESSMAGRPATALPELPATSLEARAIIGDAAWIFLDRERLQQFGRVPSRLLGRTVTANWNEYFDGVVVIREEVAPQFELWH